MRILICDDHALFAEGLKLVLEEIDGKLAVSVCGSAEEAMALASRTPFDLILLDWHLRGLTGEAALVALHEAAAESTIVIVSGERDMHLVRRAVELGAASFIPKDASKQEFRAALATLARGALFLPAAALETAGAPATAGGQLELADAFPGLTARQCDVLRAMLRGHSNKLIARHLGLSPETVKSHVRAVFDELQVHSRAEAVYVAARRGVRIH
ncbi:response regulator [Ramlibacter albus]|uniref:Response regulator transcription factor n=1 Tax=Ramlibacter albus TaxID=2079448 RepID=A0A923S610_9BURK|nr:response regulator transcription factor [Ramlibacter albus]MBC5765697.1 response regulator transcription factor [Ramlibacter albus]